MSKVFSRTKELNSFIIELAKQVPENLHFRELAIEIGELVSSFGGIYLNNFRLYTLDPLFAPLYIQSIKKDFTVFEGLSNSVIERLYSEAYHNDHSEGADSIYGELCKIEEIVSILQAN